VAARQIRERRWRPVLPCGGKTPCSCSRGAFLLGAKYGGLGAGRKARHERPCRSKSRAAIKSGWELVHALIRSAGTHAIGELAAGTAAGVGSDLAVQGLEQAAE
jgi:hypothetical protein